jgi:hypothetical protein
MLRDFTGHLVLLAYRNIGGVYVARIRGVGIQGMHAEFWWGYRFFNVKFEDGRMTYRYKLRRQVLTVGSGWSWRKFVLPVLSLQVLLP